MPAEFDRRVKALTKAAGVRNPYAVARASMKKTKKKRSGAVEKAMGRLKMPRMPKL